MNTSPINNDFIEAIESILFADKDAAGKTILHYEIENLIPALTSGQITLLDAASSTHQQGTSGIFTQIASTMSQGERMTHHLVDAIAKKITNLEMAKMQEDENAITTNYNHLLQLCRMTRDNIGIMFGNNLPKTVPTLKTFVSIVDIHCNNTKISAVDPKDIQGEFYNPIDPQDWGNAKQNKIAQQPPVNKR